MLGESDLVLWTVTLLWAALTGIGIPWLGMRMLVPTLVTSDRIVTNYRGREVALGLGLVWALWLGGVLVFFAGTTYAWLLGDLPALGRAGGPLDFAVTLVGGAFVFGLIDDMFGSSAERGFRGHLGALAKGRLTTGGLKLLGIGLISLLGGAHMTLAERLTVGSAIHGLAAAAVLALAANTLNLFDLRPGRALKVYTLLAAVGLVALALSLLGPGAVAAGVLGEIGVVALFCLGPLLAVWRFDLGEAGMLGDAGANGLGMWIGIIFVVALPPAGTVLLALALFALNLASERVSFSSVIEQNRGLSAIDQWGRQREVSRIADTTE